MPEVDLRPFRFAGRYDRWISAHSLGPRRRLRAPRCSRARHQQRCDSRAGRPAATNSMPLISLSNGWDRPLAALHADPPNRPGHPRPCLPPPFRSALLATEPDRRPVWLRWTHPQAGLRLRLPDRHQDRRPRRTGRVRRRPDRIGIRRAASMRGRWSGWSHHRRVRRTGGSSSALPAGQEQDVRRNPTIPAHPQVDEQVSSSPGEERSAIAPETTVADLRVRRPCALAFRPPHSFVERP